jgi:hypothetical protein
MVKDSKTSIGSITSQLKVDKKKKRGGAAGMQRTILAGTTGFVWMMMSTAGRK